MKDQNSVFDADSKSLHSLFISEGGVAGFRIPVYQRQYDWDKSNVIRLFEDILSGLIYCVEDEDSLTFLGTIIVLTEEKKERGFDGESLAIIDGQQRLTTVAIIACLLHEKIRQRFDEYKNSPLFGENKDFEGWISDEISQIKTMLVDFSFGEQRVGPTSYPFPRVIRENEDNRDKSFQDSEYRSTIGSFLFEFSQHIKNDRSESFEFDFNKISKDTKFFSRNVELIKNLLDFNDDDDTELNVDFIKNEDFQKRGIRELYKKLTNYNESQTNRITAHCAKSKGIELNLLRLIVFSRYLMAHVHVTLVKTRHEKYAFDIFDSLNTTGEPLTAIQTFKPQVIRFENEEKKYEGSTCEECFETVNSYLDNYSSSDARQKESKEIVVSFALYNSGKKETLSLDPQRKYLRGNFNLISGSDKKRDFVNGLKEIVVYKSRFWSSNDFGNSLISDEAKLCLMFLRDMKNTLSIPILARFYFESQKKGNQLLFDQAVKALTAYIVIRRASTVGTASIDSDLRAIMAIGRRVKNKLSIPLCKGVDKTNRILTIEEFQEYLREWLEKSKVEITSMKTWVDKISSVPIYSSSGPLTRFVLLAAYNHTRILDNGELQRARNSMETEYFNSSCWTRKEFGTVEHVAPDSMASNSGWDTKIYEVPHLRHTIGNLVLLPKPENEIVANKDWISKKKYYDAFSSETIEGIESIEKEGKSEGFVFSSKSKQILKINEHLPMIRSIVNVEVWDAEFIKKRSENLANLAWEQFATWLGYE